MTGHVVFGLAACLLVVVNALFWTAKRDVGKR